ESAIHIQQEAANSAQFFDASHLENLFQKCVVSFVCQKVQKPPSARSRLKHNKGLKSKYTSFGMGELRMS
ncbi:MAG: hypothetical protein COY47_02695, partial [Chloroflexi bacterium CG_4_10_14_0_8_um_filter_57_5]